MNVFVLSTGRCGSLTLARALSHATNYTVGHETRVHLVYARLDYPDRHVEVDNRLVWFLGGLEQRYSDALYVHLTRNSNEVAASLVRRWEEKIYLRRLGALVHPRRTLEHVRAYMKDPFGTERATGVKAFAYGQLMPREPWAPRDRLPVATLLVETITENIQAFLKDKNWVKVQVQSFEADVSTLWRAMGAQGDLAAALGELRHHYNQSRRV